MDAILRIEGMEPDLPPRGAGRREMPPEDAQAPRSKTALPTYYWLIAWGLVIVVLIVSFGLGGAGTMEFPTTVSRDRSRD